MIDINEKSYHRINEELINFEIKIACTNYKTLIELILMKNIKESNQVNNLSRLFLYEIQKWFSKENEKNDIKETIYVVDKEVSCV